MRGGEAAPVAVAVAPVSASSASTPAAVRGAWGGDVIVLSLTRDVYVLVLVLVLVLRFVLRFVLRSDAVGGVGWGCRVGTIGPVTGQPASAGDSTGVGRGVRCVATAMRPGTYPVAVAPLPGGFADENAFENAFGNPPTLAYAPAKASASPHRGSLFVQPGVVVASPGGGSSLNSQKVSVVSADASLVPLAFAASEATARGFASGVRCVVGGAVVGGAWDVRDPHRDDDAALDALRDRLAASCGNGFSRLSPGFTVVHVAWVPSGRNGLM